MSSTTKMRVIEIPEVVGRPEMSSREETGVAGLLLMAKLVKAAMAFQQREARVERDVVRVLKVGARTDE